MAALVYLDVDDEITSAASRIRAGDDPHVALVVPYGSRLATSRINFRLLAREAVSRGRTLSVVAGDAATRALAASAGLAVFPSVGDFEAADRRPDAPGTDGADAGAPSTGTPAPPTSTGVDARPGEPPPRTDASPASARPGRRRGGRPGARTTGPSDDTVVMPAGAGAAGGAAAAAGAAAGAVAARPADEAGAGASRPRARERRLAALPMGRTAGIAVAAVLALVLLAVGVGAYLFLPTAEITLTTRMERIGPVALEIRADPGVTAVDPETGVIPAERLTFDVAVSDTFPATGRRVEADAATGRVTFRSKDPVSDNTIPSGSTVATPNGIRFRTTAAVVVPKATIVGLTIVPGEATVAIRAVEEGPAGNVEANAITVIPRGEDPTFTEVRNPEPTTGGRQREFPRVSQKDVDAALDTLTQELAAEFDRVVADPNRLPPGLRVFSETAVLGEALPTTDPATLPGQEVTEFTLGLSATGTVVAVDETPVERVARTRIAGEVDDGYRLVEGSIEVEPGDPVVGGETITFPVTARAAQLRTVDPDALLEQIKGKPIPQARAILEPYGLVEITVWPDWVTAIPSLDHRVALRVQPPPGAPGASPGMTPSASPEP